MKKYAILGLVSAALVFASCALKGGTIEVKNNTSNNALIYIMQGDVPVVAEESLPANGGTKTFSFDEDGTYTVNAIFYIGSNPPPEGVFNGHGDKKAVLLGGNKVSVSVKPTN